MPEITNQLGKLAPLLESAGVILVLEFDPSVYATNTGKTSAILNFEIVKYSGSVRSGTICGTLMERSRIRTATILLRSIFVMFI
ncbi:hypothetical protein SAMN05443246_5323 [Paenibacillus sp. GP183]|nr:hypothetical protein SAMN05443246_5323 [Paenibacillus sp. GP183]